MKKKMYFVVDGMFQNAKCINCPLIKSNKLMHYIAIHYVSFRKKYTAPTKDLFHRKMLADAIQSHLHKTRRFFNFWRLFLLSTFFGRVFFQ